MKKQIPSTFILNANDVACFFVEGKHTSKYGPVYRVYYNSKQKPVLYTASNFVEVHGLNNKESIIKFTERALLDLIVLNGYNNKVSEIYDVFRNVHDLVITQDHKKPKLGKLKKSLIDAICSYNDMKELLPGMPEISYEEDYELVTREREVKKVEKIVTTSKRQQVKQIVTGVENSRGIQRKLKYD